MAMDKEQLLAYFQQHYLSRREVLFKLPLNISIDTFWPELLNRRKAGANILSLFNASGMPYWYVLTDRMVKASESLCTEAMEQEDSFDPYRTAMTSAMTEEMFFTSFVEGAQIPLQEAMDFLQRGTEPENIQEQMIWNNRHAWSVMVSSLYRPLDEEFVKSLAFMLTEEMDDCAEDYRQTDQHTIAAMNNEPYEVPSAFSIPDRMADYYAFLQKGDIHPLIKSAVGQAYILVARPFPEGNERLSRMISSAVLLRSGYDFFRDISISGIIARENYRYYKSMCEIIRNENGGDLTYFIEYYLELLVRAMNFKKERERKNNDELLSREQELARQPFKNEVGKSQSMIQLREADLKEDQVKLEEETILSKKTVGSFMDRVRTMKGWLRGSRHDYTQRIQEMLDRRVTRFTVKKWSDIHQINRKDADYECRILYQRGLLDKNTTSDGVMEYSFKIAEEKVEICINPQRQEEVLEVESAAPEPHESPPAGILTQRKKPGRANKYIFSVDSEEGSECFKQIVGPVEAFEGITENSLLEDIKKVNRICQPQESNPQFWETLKIFEKDFSVNKKRAVPIIKNLLKNGIFSFTCAQWRRYSGMGHTIGRRTCNYMQRANLTDCTICKQFHGHKVFTFKVDPNEIEKMLAEGSEITETA